MFAFPEVILDRVKCWCVYISPFHAGGELGQLFTYPKYDTYFTHHIESSAPALKLATLAIATSTRADCPLITR